MSNRHLQAQPERNVTLRDVADLSGVAVSTVSRVLNNEQKANGFSVREETRERILLAAKELNYRPDPILRTMRAKRTRLIAVLGLIDFGTSVLGSTERAMNAMMRDLIAGGYQLCTLPKGADDEMYTPPRWRVDGAIVVDCPDVERLNDLDSSGTPYVSLNGPAGANGISVGVDDVSGTNEALHHLMVLGHRKVAFVMPHENVKDHPSIAARFGAYCDVLRRWGIEPVTPDATIPASPLEAISEFVVNRGATALLVYQHVMAVKLLRAARIVGMRIPQDFSLICFNDDFPTADVVPSLTAMSLPSEEMGRTAARLLIERLEQPERKSKAVLLSESLVIRESTAPPPAAGRERTET